MNRFVKDNLTLFAVTGGAWLCAVVLLIFAVIWHAKMFSYFASAEKLRPQIAELINQKPAPVAGNEAPMQEDIKFYREKVAELLPHFGQIKEPALNAFVRELGVNREEFLEMFRNAWNSDEDRKAQGGRLRFYQRFSRGNFDEYNWAKKTPFTTDEARLAAWRKASRAFAAEYQKLTIEVIDDGNLPDVFLSVMGIPRNYEGRGDWCMQDFMVPMRGKMLDLCSNPSGAEKTSKDDVQPNKMDVLGGASSFGFNYQKEPALEEIPDIVRNWEVIGDLVSRMVQEGLSSLNSFYIRNLAGEKQGRYMIYHYTFSVSGDIGRIRSFVKNLNEAAKENRMYIVRSIFLYSDRDGAREIFLERQHEAQQKRLELDNAGRNESAAKTTPAAAERETAKPLERGEKPPQTPAQIRMEELKKPYHERIGYGRLLFGGSPNCEAVFDVEYVYLAEQTLE